MLKKLVAMMGTIQWILGVAVQPKKKRQIGRQKQPTSANSRRIWGKRISGCVAS